jgi:hypothetical protein
MTGTMLWGVLSYAERDDWLNNLVADLSALYFRMPQQYGYGAGRWLSLGDLTEDPGGLGPQQDMRFLSAPFTEVDPPSVVVG